MKRQRPTEDIVFGKQDAQSIIDSVQPPKWFTSACTERDASAIQDNAGFLDLESAKRLVEHANTLTVRGAWNALRSRAQNFLASFEDAAWGGRRAD